MSSDKAFNNHKSEQALASKMRVVIQSIRDLAGYEDVYCPVLAHNSPLWGMYKTLVERLHYVDSRQVAYLEDHGLGQMVK